MCVASRTIKGNHRDGLDTSSAAKIFIFYVRLKLSSDLTPLLLKCNGFPVVCSLSHITPQYCLPHVFFFFFLARCFRTTCSASGLFALLFVYIFFSIIQWLAAITPHQRCSRATSLHSGFQVPTEASVLSRLI